MVDDAHHDRSGPDPQAGPPPFDSLAGLRALGDIQRRGLEAANLVISRLVAPDAGGPLFGAEPPRPGGADAGPAAAAPDLAAQYAAMATSFLGALAGAAAPASDGGAPRGAAPPSGLWADPLALPATVAGGRSEGELWVHNRSGDVVADVRIHCGDLRSPDGWAVPAARVTFAPGTIDELPDLTSRGVRAQVEVPADTPPGTYRGTVLAANLPDVWMVVELEVVPGP